MGYEIINLQFILINPKLKYFEIYHIMIDTYS